MVNLAKKVLKETVEVKGLILIFLCRLFDSAVNKPGIKNLFSPLWPSIEPVCASKCFP